jgi:hypothetical protein
MVREGTEEPRPLPDPCALSLLSGGAELPSFVIQATSLCPGSSTGIWHVAQGLDSTMGSVDKQCVAAARSVSASARVLGPGR